MIKKIFVLTISANLIVFNLAVSFVQSAQYLSPPTVVEMGDNGAVVLDKDAPVVENGEEIIKDIVSKHPTKNIRKSGLFGKGNLAHVVFLLNFLMLGTAYAFVSAKYFMFGVIPTREMIIMAGSYPLIFALEKINFIKKKSFLKRFNILFPFLFMPVLIYMANITDLSTGIIIHGFDRQYRGSVIEYLNDMPDHLHSGIKMIMLEDDGYSDYQRSCKLIRLGALMSLPHEVGHHGYSEYLDYGVRGKLQYYHINFNDDFKHISIYAQYEASEIITTMDEGKRIEIRDEKRRILELYCDGPNIGREAFAEVCEIWIREPELLFFNEKIMESEALRYYIETVGSLFVNTSGDGKYCRLYCPGILGRGFVDIPVETDNPAYEELRKKYLAIIADKVPKPEVCSSVNKVLSILYGEEVTDRDLFIETSGDIVPEYRYLFEMTTTSMEYEIYDLFHYLIADNIDYKRIVPEITEEFERLLGEGSFSDDDLRKVFQDAILTVFKPEERPSNGEWFFEVVEFVRDLIIKSGEYDYLKSGIKTQEAEDLELIRVLNELQESS